MQEPTLELVSVVIPVYNAEKHLEATLASVFAQTYQNIEIVAVDDGSQDRSVSILEQYPDRVRVIKQSNKGAAAARNRGVREAKGEWIAFIDADDLWTDDKVQRQLEACGQFDWSHTDSIFLGGVNDGCKDSDFTAKYQGNVLNKLVCGNFIGTSSCMIRRKVFLESCGFNESLRSIQDWELWVRISKYHAIGYLDTPSMIYRVHSISTSRNTRKTLPRHLEVIEMVFAPGGPGEFLRHLKHPAMARSCGICSQIAEEEGDFSFALYCSLLACRYDFFVIYRWKRAIKLLIKSLLFLVSTRARSNVSQS